jgi:prevent-host-death family protein
LYIPLYNTEGFARGLSREIPGPARGAGLSSDKRRDDTAVFQCMPRQLHEFGPPKLLHSVTTEELRSKLSETINRAGFGVDPVLVTRRGTKIAAIISLVDLVFLENMKKRREEIMTENVPDGPDDVGPEMGRRLGWEFIFGRYP